MTWRFSTDHGATYNLIEQGITDKEYTWADPGTLEAGDSCWFRVTAYSPGRTLTGRVTSQKASVYEPDSATVNSPEPAASAPDGFTLYPNPASDFLFIESHNPGIIPILHF